MLASHRNTVQVLERTDDSEPYTFAPSSISFQREMCPVLALPELKTPTTLVPIPLGLF